MASASAERPPAPGGARRWRDLRKRALSAAILGPLALLAIWLGAGWYTLMIALGTAVLAWEWVHLCGLRVRGLPGLAVPLALLAAGLAAVAGWHLLALLLLPAGALAAIALAKGTAAGRPPPRAPRASPLWLGAGVIYVGLAGIGLIWLRGEGEAGRAAVLFIVIVVWASDIGAYAVGRLLGGPRLAPSVSPNKTWSGALGGLAAAVAAGMGVALAHDPSRAGVAAAAIAALLGIAAAAGDLLESAIKRHFRVKDASNLIPGHGGLLDRVDGLLAAVPAGCVIALAQAAARGGDGLLWT